MCFHDLIIHMCTRPVEPQFIVIMVINVVDLLLVGCRTWVAFYYKTSVQIFEPIKQQLTEHSTILCAFFVFTARHVIQLRSIGFNCV